MTWKQRLASRKFWVAVVPAVLAIVAASTGWDLSGISPETIIGLAGVLMAYLFGQSWVDKTAVSGQADIVKNESLLQAQAYIKYLESELAKLSGDGSELE